MKKLELKEVNKKRKKNPLFKGFPSRLKDPASFEVVEKQLFDILQSGHKHKTASSYVRCSECMEKREERKRKMKELGFKSMQQYLEWKKIMDIIINKKDFQLK